MPHLPRLSPRYMLIPAAIAIAIAFAACGGSDDDTIQNNVPPIAQGRWIAGDLHTHTTQSADADVSQTLDKILGKAFTIYGLDWMAVTNHLRVSTRDDKGVLLAAPIPMATGVERYEMPRLAALQAGGSVGTYADKLIFSGFEWDMPTHDHIGIGIFEGSDKSAGAPLAVSTRGVREFEYLFTTRDAAMFDAADLTAWKAKYGDTRYNKTGDDALKAISWLKDNYPTTSYAVINHPSRNKGSYTVEDFRRFNDTAPDIMFAIEGMVGNQMEPDRGGYTAAYTAENAPLRAYGGTDYVVAKLGGVWDALLGEGRRVWNLTDSDTHFKIVGSNSSGYFPGEYAKNYVFNSATGTPTAKDLLQGLRSGKMFSVYGDLVNALDFNLASTSDRKEMGGELKVASGEKVVVTIRFKSPAKNNYEKPVDSGASASVKPVVDHVDLIVGDVGAKAAQGTAAYAVATNASTRVVKRFTSADWKTDADGYNTITYETTATRNQYFRLRGTNLGTDVAGLTQAGEPLADQRTSTADATQRFNDINDRNYRSLWFYSNPVFVTVR
ncbi:S-layer protein [Duganella phyllosphaerae]|uniref:S-layer protein n=1 Tax=Duganella phyllosphaerae TaxID=762836 RepID=A0A1E7WC23_9BURK|nr:S-layer protein [Duganella phyllosphaerae]OEZ94551.1 hypothetical protein DUPY_45040 [Duganella phyllosphaerae]